MTEQEASLGRAWWWALRLASVPIALLVLWVALLAFPQLLMLQRAQAGEVTIHYDGSSGVEIEALAAEVSRRLLGSGLYDSTKSRRVFYFRNQKLYGFFARLARVPPEVQGFALSFVDNSFVSESGVRALGARTGGLPKYSIWEGSPAHTVAHELAHLDLTNRIGRDRWKKLPHWKQEGLPEYVANIASIRSDGSTDLASRLHILQDDRNWISAQSWDRIHFRAALLVEFQIEIRDHTLADVLEDSVTEHETLADLVTWAGNREH